MGKARNKWDKIRAVPTTGDEPTPEDIYDPEKANVYWKWFERWLPKTKVKIPKNCKCC